MVPDSVGRYEIVKRKVFHCQSTMSEKFQVFAAKNFPGMKESTDISQFLVQQGLRMRVRSKNLNVPVLPENFKSASTTTKRLPKRKSSDEREKPSPPTYPASKCKVVNGPQPQSYPRPVAIRSAPSSAIGGRKTSICKHPPLPGPEGMLSGHKPESSSRNPLFLTQPMKSELNLSQSFSHDSQ